MPTREQLASWRTFLRAHALVIRALENELVEAPGHRLRMTELADAVLLSRAGGTRLVDRLEKAGLVSRCRVAGDGRGVAAQLTEAGVNRLRTASRTHLTGVMRHFVDPLDDDIDELERITRRLAD